MQLRDTVLVVNQHFIPERRDSPYIYGVVQHALRAADILSAHGARVSFILYERVDGIGAPKLRCHEILGQFPAVTVSFHFDMEAETLTRAFREAVCTVSGRRSDSSPLVYYQTSAVLPFAPIEFDCVVTHHSPFVLHVADVIGWPLTHKAFEWDHAKVEHLLHVQEEGLAIVRARDRIICAEISPLQVQWLQAEGVPPERIVALAQPLACPLQPASLPAALVELLGTSGLIAVTAVSRLDDFKNVELFVRGSCLALENGDLARAAVIGGFPRDVERERLRALVPSRFRETFLFEPRISHAALAGHLFHDLAGRAVFVCSSRFDLVPYTALEAARAGLCTVVADVQSVGARAYLPERYRFRPTPEELAACLKRFRHEPTELGGFERTGLQIRRATSDEAFLSGFHNVCTRF